MKEEKFNVTTKDGTFVLVRHKGWVSSKWFLNGEPVPAFFVGLHNITLASQIRVDEIENSEIFYGVTQKEFARFMRKHDFKRVLSRFQRTEIVKSVKRV